MTQGDWLLQAKNKLKDTGISSAELDARLVLEHVTGASHEELIAHPEAELETEVIKAADELISQRAERRPLSQILANRSFYDLDIEVTVDVLTPRIETETMVETVIKEAPKGAALLDVGTGSGAIAVAIAKHRPDMQITATDVSSAALKVAGRNAKRHEVKIKFATADIFDGVDGRFDVVTANLPYLRDDADLMPEVQKEPRVALVGGADGLDLYRRFFDQVSNHLNPGGLVMIEADPWQHDELKTMATKPGLKLAHEHYFILGFSNS